MKFNFTSRVTINDAGSDGSVFPDAFFRAFQQAAIEHSDSVGYSHIKLDETNRVWMLHSLSYRLTGDLKLYDTFDVETWSRGMLRFKGFREFILRKDGVEIGTASSVWLYIDTLRRRPSKIEDEMFAAYKQEPDATPSAEVENWQPPVLSDKAASVIIYTRISDFDVNGHMNNTVYPLFVYQAFADINGVKKDFKEFTIEYAREIQHTVKTADVRIEKSDGGYIFSVSDGTQINASGCFRI